MRFHLNNLLALSRPVHTADIAKLVLIPLRPSRILLSPRPQLRSLRTMTVPSHGWVPGRYPPAYRSDHVDVYMSETKGQVQVNDPYQWLEHNTPETEAWTTAQEKFTRQFLDQNADRQALEDKIRENTDYAKVRPCLSCVVL